MLRLFDGIETDGEPERVSDSDENYEPESDRYNDSSHSERNQIQEHNPILSSNPNIPSESSPTFEDSDHEDNDWKTEIADIDDFTTNPVGIKILFQGVIEMPFDDKNPLL